MAKYNLHQDRFFDPCDQVRNVARDIYNSVKDLPIVAPHGHVEPIILAENKPFPNPTELIFIPDHYIFRMMYSQGITMENMGIPTINGDEVESDPKKIWKLFAENYYLFSGTPSGVWLDYEFNKIFGIEEKLDGDNALKIYDELLEKIQSPEFLPRNLFETFNIELLTTTDSATDNLKYHKQINESGWNGRVIPCFRPDALTDISKPDWKNQINLLGDVVGREINSFNDYIKAIEERRTFFKSMGTTSTDHGVFSSFTHELETSEIEDLFERAINGETNEEDAMFFTAHMLMEMARMSTEDGLVMQIHPGSLRGHNPYILEKYGSDKGCDIPMQTDFTFNLKELLNKYGNNPDFTVIVFTLDETAYSRELAPLAGHYPSMKLGPAWWFHDSIDGMMRYRERVTETAGFYNTVGFNDDTRAFVSIPARHDVSRRVDANFLARKVASRVLTLEEAKEIAYQLTYTLVKKNYKL